MTVAEAAATVRKRLTHGTPGSTGCYVTREEALAAVDVLETAARDSVAQSDEKPSDVRGALCDYCGSLGWTVAAHGRVTHKHSCPHSTEPWCQAHPAKCAAALPARPGGSSPGAQPNTRPRDWGQSYEELLVERDRLRRERDDAVAAYDSMTAELSDCRDYAVTLRRKLDEARKESAAWAETSLNIGREHGAQFRRAEAAEADREQLREALARLLDTTDSSHITPGINPDGSVSVNSLARTLARAAVAATGAAKEEDE